MQIQSKVAVCLITGNEEAIIGRALDSAFTVSDTVIVVRAIGGAKPDSSLEIARQRGCIVGEYHNSPATASWPYVDDFAAARNEAFRLASQTDAEWFMWLDCDDYLEPRAGEAIRKAVADTKEEWILADYWLPQHGKAVPRERLFRRGTAAWFNGVHEKCIPVTADLTRESLNVRVCRTFRVVHDPAQGKSGSQERNINILRWRDQETQHIKFYLHYEYFLLGNREEAVKYGLEALRLEDLCGVYRYEVFLNLALLAEKNEHGQDLCQRAIKLCPERREAHNILAVLQMDAVQTGEAIKTAEHALTLPPPRMPEWTHRPDVYGWKGHATLAWAHRLAGHEDEAAKIETKMLDEAKGPRISLLHATRGRWPKAIAMMSAWMQRAENPEAVEHWFAVDEDDTEGREKLSRSRHVITSKDGYSVGAWNAAAARSTGNILVQMADDFEPPVGWDRQIIEALGDKINEPVVLRVSDGIREDGLITMAIITRPWYEAHGLFDAAFRNVYSDNDLTQRALKAKAVIDAKHITFRHQHPLGDSKAQWDATYQRGNDPDEYKRAEQIYAAKHPKLV
jgi:glycosyltransferase involved in cell wall biosynthesis